MIKPEDTDQFFISSRPPSINFSPLNNQKERQKRPIKPEPEENLMERKRKIDPATPSLFAYSVAEFNECSKCEKARLAGLDAWMDHLGLFHTFPTRWPSSRIEDGLLDKEHPYTSVVDSHKKRKSAGIPRPLNSFMVSIKLHIFSRITYFIIIKICPSVDLSNKIVLFSVYIYIYTVSLGIIQ